MKLFDHITINPKIMGGRACIRDTRIPVSLIMNLLSHGESITKIIEDYPELTKDDIFASLRYAEWTTSETFELVKV